MKKVKYIYLESVESFSTFCPFDEKSNKETIRVGSEACEKCKWFISKDETKQEVDCELCSLYKNK